MSVQTAPVYSGRKLVIQLLTAGVLIGLGAVFVRWWDASRQLEQIRQLKEVIGRLEAEHPVAHVRVLDQERDQATGAVRTTTFRFQETNARGVPLEPYTYTVEGDVAYFDALVVKFDSELVEVGDPFKGRTIYLFRRTFGEHQKPADGYPLSPGGVPIAYRMSERSSRFEKNLWERFWMYARLPEEARKDRIRVAQGEAVYTKLEPGRDYTLSIENNGGLNIKAEPVPAQ